MHGDRHPGRRDHELIPPLAVKRFLFLRRARGLLGFKLALTQQTQVVACHADEPGPTRPRNPLVDAAALLDHAHRHYALAREMRDVFEELEHNVPRALDQADGAERRVHLAARLRGRERLEPYVQRDQTREAQRGSRVGDEAAQGSEEGRACRGTRRWEFRRAADNA